MQQAANARLARVQTSNATNPTFGLSDLGTGFSYGESAAYILVLGERVSGTVNRSFVEYLFGKIATMLWSLKCTMLASTNACV